MNESQTGGGQQDQYRNDESASGETERGAAEVKEVDGRGNGDDRKKECRALCEDASRDHDGEACEDRSQ